MTNKAAFAFEDDLEHTIGGFGLDELASLLALLLISVTSNVLELLVRSLKRATDSEKVFFSLPFVFTQIILQTK